MRVPDEATTVGDHGGNLAAAARLFPAAPQPWIDLSTGINPHTYPLFPLPATAFARLPEPARAAELCAVAAAAYGAPGRANVVAAPGTQILLPLVYSLLQPGRAAVFGPTYAEHLRAAKLAGHDAREVPSLDALRGADLAIVVNPNNPDGRIVPRADLLALAADLRADGGLLVVDEAFMDVGPRAESVAGDVGQGGLVVLRSFGKFFGLAGLRLGFALADAATAARLASALGPWAVSGPALEYGLKALGDRAWQGEMRGTLAADAMRLDALLAHHGVTVAGGTHLFRFVRDPNANAVFDALGRAGVLVRRFAWDAEALRIGLPGSEDDWRRLDEALANAASSRQLEEVRP